MHRPLDRPHTPVFDADRAALCPSKDTPVDRKVSEDAWLRLKARQILEDGSTARICGDRMDLLGEMATHWPGRSAPAPRGPVDLYADDGRDDARISANPVVQKATQGLRQSRETGPRHGYHRPPRNSTGDDAA